jgi:histidinol-phosphate aminotransferase
MTRPPLRSDLELLPRYVAGRASAGFKLSSNELAGPPDPAVVTAAAQATHRLNRYPDVSAKALTGRLAAELEVPPAAVVAGGGSIAVLQQLIQATVDPGGVIVFGWRSYEAYPILARVCHAVAAPVPLSEHRHDLDAMAAEVLRTGAAMAIVCNPNNPTGTAVDEESLDRFLDRVPPTCIVVLDEAYREFVTDPSIPDGLRKARDRSNVVVLRTFSKAHALAGARVGYAIAPPEIAAAVHAVALPFTVSRVAEAAAVAALDAWPRQRAVVEAVCRRRDRFVAALRQAGLVVPGSQANFVWLPWSPGSAGLAAAIEARGVSIRPFLGDGLRVTIGEPAGLDAILESVAHTAPV